MWVVTRCDPDVAGDDRTVKLINIDHFSVIDVIRRHEPDMWAVTASGGIGGVMPYVLAAVSSQAAADAVFAQIVKALWSHQAAIDLTPGETQDR
jgi:hypothetical protein